MEKRDFANLVLSLRRDSEQKALQQALVVPWRRLADGASVRAEWHILILWVRLITETADQLPEIVRSELQSRCPGFVENLSSQKSDLPIWASLEEWITSRFFGLTRSEGWLDALMYYTYWDLRTDQAWTTWERTRAEWCQGEPPQWPTLEQWKSEVLSTHTLTHAGIQKARAVQARGRANADRLERAVGEVLEARALSLWIDSVSQPEQPLSEDVLAELRNKCPGLLPESGGCVRWTKLLFSRVVRLGDATWSKTAKSEGWYAALRYTLCFTIPVINA